MPVYAKQYGRLGNNLFQKAAAIGYAMKHCLSYDLRSTAPPACYKKYLINESRHSYQELEFHPEFPNKYAIVLDGYWQSEKYFAHCRGEVLKAFGYPWELKEGWCSIHVRRGDYLKYRDKHSTVTNDYIVDAIQEVRKQTNIERFMFFSDDIGWCKVFVQFYLPREIYYACDWSFSEGRSDREDLELMSSCQHNIISNSTFSWWGAWLNQTPNKLVISPSKDNWFGPGNAHLDTSDIIPDKWIQIKY